MNILKSDLTWDHHFVHMAREVAKKSKDPSTKVGCVIVDHNNMPRTFGYNGFPRGVLDLEERYHDRSQKLPRVVHAEANGIVAAAKIGVSLDNCKLYVLWHPCEICSGLIIQSGIREVILDPEYVMDAGLAERWKLNIEIASSMFSESGVIVRNGLF